MSQVYYCPICEARVTQEEYATGKTKCGMAACKNYQKPLVLMNKCDLCGEVYALNKTHKC